ncbi:MAG: diguanylate cyclase [Actinomycetota bacterium]|nr:diguanylate cyclase [Actinomycetota bacterium]
MAGMLAMPGRELRRSLGVETATRRVLLGMVVPMWLGAGFADWWCHRRTHIEDNAGTRESLMHLAMQAEAGVPIMLGLLFEANAGVLVASAGAVVLHDATALWDVAYAEKRRDITFVEQHIHSFLEISPLMATALLAALHWDQVAALFGKDRSPRALRLRPRRGPLEAKQRIGLIVVATMGGLLPQIEELWRCARVNPSPTERPVPAA